MVEPHWREEAVCRELDADVAAMFFADLPGVDTHLQHQSARMFCYVCPVQVECLAYALDAEQKFGVWGGLTESQRKRYLIPEVKRRGQSSEVLEDVILRCGARILRHLEPVPA